MKSGVGRRRGTVHGEERRWRFPVSNMAAVMEETDVEGGGGDRRRERWQGDRTAGTLEFFWMKAKRYEVGYYL
jgi:hypothetical protein